MSKVSGFKEGELYDVSVSVEVLCMFFFSKEKRVEPIIFSDVSNDEDYFLKNGEKV